MDHLRKSETLNIRMTAKQRARLRRAARIESRRRERVVEAGPLLLELAAPGIERILSGGHVERRQPVARVLTGVGA